MPCIPLQAISLTLSRLYMHSHSHVAAVCNTTSISISNSVPVIQTKQAGTLGKKRGGHRTKAIHCKLAAQGLLLPAKPAILASPGPSSSALLASRSSTLDASSLAPRLLSAASQQTLPQKHAHVMPIFAPLSKSTGLISQLHGAPIPPARHILILH